jgi:hypothetical protein
MEVNYTNPEMNNSPAVPPQISPVVSPSSVNTEIKLSPNSKSFITIVLLSLFGPLGLIPMWLWNDDWQFRTKIVVTIFTLLPVLLVGLYIQYLVSVAGL